MSEQTCLLIGGKSDGVRMRVDVRRTQLEVRERPQFSADPSVFTGTGVEYVERREVYLAHGLHTGKKALTVYAIDSIPADQVLSYLVAGYHEASR